MSKTPWFTLTRGAWLNGWGLNNLIREFLLVCKAIFFYGIPCNEENFNNLFLHVNWKVVKFKELKFLIPFLTWKFSTILEDVMAFGITAMPRCSRNRSIIWNSQHDKWNSFNFFSNHYKISFSLFFFPFHQMNTLIEIFVCWTKYFPIHC